MALTHDQDARLTQLLQGLEGCLDDLYPNARSFVKDQLDRHEQYGSRVFMSPKQWKWLEDLYAEFIGDDELQTPAREEEAVDERMGRSKRDRDDDIPF